MAFATHLAVRPLRECQHQTTRSRVFMPRDNDRNDRGRPPGRRGPPRGKDGPPRGDRPRQDRGGGGKGFGGGKPGERGFGEKRPFAGKGKSDFRRDGDRPPRREFSRDERGPRRSFGDGPDRSNDKPWQKRASFRRDDAARDDRPARQRDEERGPRARTGPDRPRGDRPFRDRPQGERPYRGRPDGDKPFRGKPRDDDRRGERGGDRPRGDRPFRSRSEGDRPQGDRPYRGKPSGDRPFRGKPRDDDRGGDRGAERPRGDRPFRDRPQGERPYRGKPSGDRPFRGKPRDDDRGGERGGDRPRFSRDRDDRPDRREQSAGRPRQQRVSRGGHAWRDQTWRDHPRNEEFARDERSPRPDNRFEDRERGPRDEPGDRGEGRREYQKRPAFGGRGAYREKKPGTEKSFRKNVDAPKKSGERIAKRIARAGLCSRREAEDWIRDGRVVVNGRVIDSPALDVHERDVIAVDGAPLPERERTRLFLYHKPRGLVTTHNDPEQRQTIFEALPKDLPRLISVGRLDYNTEGLLLLTNDGGLKRILELPDTGWLRRYRVRAHGAITQARLDELRDGIEVEGVKYGPIEATLDQETGANVWITFAIREGKNREVRNVLAHLGLEVNRLIRISYGPFQLGELAEGEVSEVRGRLLRDQLGERIAREAGVDFSGPRREAADVDDAAGEAAEAAAPLPPRERHGDEAPRAKRRQEGERPKPRGRAGLISDGKGRRVLVQRVGAEPRDDERRGGHRRPGPRSRPYKGNNDRKPRRD